MAPCEAGRHTPCAKTDLYLRTLVGEYSGLRRKSSLYLERDRLVTLFFIRRRRASRPTFFVGTPEKLSSSLISGVVRVYPLPSGRRVADAHLTREDGILHSHLATWGRSIRRTGRRITTADVDVSKSDFAASWMSTFLFRMRPHRESFFTRTRLEATLVLRTEAWPPAPVLHRQMSERLRP